MEPLKNKTVTQDNYIIGEKDRLYYEKDIKSVIELLKHHLKESYFKGELDEAMIELLIDTDFEDVAR